MIAYCFDDKGRYVGTRECQIDPVRSKREGKTRYLLPGNSTFAAPVEYDHEKEIAVWTGESWTINTIIEPEPEPEPEREPTQLDMIEAQVTYTAMMTDTLLGV